MTIQGQSLGWLLGLIVLILSILILFLSAVGVFPLDAPLKIVFVFTGVLGLARMT